MDRWLAKIVALLDSGDREQRRAAARVLGALQPTAPEVVQALGRALEGEDRRLRLRALDALGAIGGAGTFGFILPLLGQEGDLGKRAARVLARADGRILGEIKKRFRSAGPTARRRMLMIAVLMRGADGMDLIVRALQQGFAEEVLQVGNRLADELADSGARDRKALFSRLDKFLSSRRADKDADAAGAAVDLIGRIMGPDSKALLLKHAQPGNPGFVRGRALEALARLAAEAPLAPDRLTAILGYLLEKDYANVVAPAMAVLERAKLASVHATPLLNCLHGSDPALRRFAVSALGQVDTPKSAAALLETLNGDNPDLRKRAAVALSKQQAAIPLVVSELARAADANTAWILARILHPHLHGLRPEQVTTLARAGSGWLEPGDPRAEAVISVLGDRHMEQLAVEGLKLVKKAKRGRNAGAIVNLMRPLLRNGGFASADVRYEVALAEIVRGKKDVVREVRLNNPGLRALESLLHEPDFGLPTRLKREKRFLTPEEYYLIGCHFAERPFTDRIFGGDLLLWIVRTFPEDSSSQAAAHKLIMEGFPPPPRPRKKRTAKRVSQKKAVAPKKPTRKTSPPKRAPARTKTSKKASKKTAKKARKKPAKRSPRSRS